MNLGMMWWDGNSKVTVSERIAVAVKYYKNKRGRLPDLVYVHPSMVVGLLKDDELSVKVDEIEVRTDQYIMPNHFWLVVSNGNGKVGVSELPG